MATIFCVFKIAAPTDGLNQGQTPKLIAILTAPPCTEGTGYSVILRTIYSR